MLPKNSEIILVTSAFHMPRAEKVFQNQNLKVIPYPVDFRSSEKIVDILDFLPHAKASKIVIFISEKLLAGYIILFDIEYL